MATLLPEDPIEVQDLAAEYVSMDEADQLFDALAAGTAREILRALHEEPTTKSALSSQLDTSIQNVSYHLEKLEAAGLVAAEETWYSTKGREMDVYVPTADPLILVSEFSAAD
jgi:DNA-binding transcriptional ArsR family regulator